MEVKFKKYSVREFNQTQQTRATTPLQGIQNRRLLQGTLRNTPLLPVFLAALPCSVYALNTEYRTMELTEWENVKMSS